MQMVALASEVIVERQRKEISPKRTSSPLSRSSANTAARRVSTPRSSWAYPVYAPGREPAGYKEWLKKQEPVVLWDDDHTPPLKTEADWIKAGEIVFRAPVFSDASDNGVIGLADVHSKTWIEKGGVPLTKEGIVPFVHYVIREKGKIELGSFSCAMCHTRVMPDGTTITGAQGNFPFERATKYSPRSQPPLILQHAFHESLYGVPWLHPDPVHRENDLSPDETLELLRTIPPGVMSRHRASSFNPVQVPDLIGVKDRRYLDRTVSSRTTPPLT